MKQLKISQKITNRDSKSIERYFIEIDKFPKLSIQEEVECAIKIRSEDPKESEKALNKLVNSNLKFVVSVAKQYMVQNISLADLINVGNEGLIRAAHGFDETKGFKFISYAVWWIRQSIMKHIQECGKTVRLPVSKSAKINQYKKLENLFLQDFQEKPTIEQVADSLKITQEDALIIVNLSEQNTVSLDKKVNPDGESEEIMADFLEDVLAEENIYKEVNNQSLNKDLMCCISILNEKERFVIIKYFNIDGEGENSLESIAKQISSSKERVRQIKERALNKLNDKKIKQKLVHYL